VVYEIKHFEKKKYIKNKYFEKTHTIEA